MPLKATDEGAQKEEHARLLSKLEQAGISAARLRSLLDAAHKKGGVESLLADSLNEADKRESNLRFLLDRAERDHEILHRLADGDDPCAKPWRCESQEQPLQAHRRYVRVLAETLAATKLGNHIAFATGLGGEGPATFGEVVEYLREEASLTHGEIGFLRALYEQEGRLPVSATAYEAHERRSITALSDLWKSRRMETLVEEGTADEQ